MTTSDLPSALRLALTTLVSSLSLKGGLPPNLTDSDLAPDERLAARMVRRLRLHPRVDVEAIAASLADVGEKHFPIAIDGLCLDLKIPDKRPKIWISKAISDVRRRFTLAHEIGHIIIPWHTGSIVDVLEIPHLAEGRYKEMEVEANRFAAELLMPSEWVRETAARCEHITGLLTTIQRVADVSFEAANIRTVRYGSPGYIGARVENGVITQTRRTKGTRSNPPERGTLINHVRMPTAEEPVILCHGDLEYHWWKVDNDVLPGRRPEQEWRSILVDILETIPSEHRNDTMTRLNAIVGNAIGRLEKGSSVAEIYGRVLAATANRSGSNPYVSAAMQHRLFDSYVLARCYERAGAT